jgi:general secretion pathway protein D
VNSRCRLVILAIAMALSGCQTTQQDGAVSATPNAPRGGSDAAGNGMTLVAARNPNDPTARNTSDAPSPVIGVPDPKVSYLNGTGRFIGDPPSMGQGASDKGESTVTLNLAGVSVPQAAKAVLGDILGVKYTVDPGIEGKVTIQTPQPIPKSSAVDLFQIALRSNNVAVINTGEQLKIVPADQVAVGANIRLDGLQAAEDRVGSHVQIVQLQYVSAAEMRQLLEPIAPRGGIVRADNARNTITLSGTSQEIAGMLQAISIFDVDVMKGMSFALVPVTTAQPDAVATQLREVFASSREGPMAGMVHFLPNKQLSAVLVISPQQKYLARAAEWVRRLDSQAEGSQKQVYTYTAQNRRAQELVDVLLPMFTNGANGTRSNTTGRNVAPQYQEVGIQPSTGSGLPPTAGAPATGNGLQPASFAANPSPPTMRPNSSAGATQAPQPDATTTDPRQEQRFKIAVDEGKNSILIEATPADYRRAMAVIRGLDIMPKQVLIEVTIAEVSLNDELKFGVRWFLNNKNGSSYTFTDAPSGSIASVFPGFSYALTAANIAGTLNALNSITNVNIISSPSLTVMDNRAAYLQIGDEVPITTQTAESVLTPGAPVVNSISYKDTGIILSIMPHINASGRVLLDLEQEVSSVVQTTSSGIDSPTIRQRRIKTSVVVNNGEGLALGGLIEHQNTTTQGQVPLLGSIPVLGNAFKNRDNTIEKTELMIFITPTVMRNLNEARAVTEEYRQAMLRDFPAPVSVPLTVDQALKRTLVE